MKNAKTVIEATLAFGFWPFCRPRLLIAAAKNWTHIGHEA
jgi:hypothetical protein